MTLKITIAKVTVLFQEVGVEFHDRLSRIFSRFISETAQPDMEISRKEVAGSELLFQARAITLRVHPASMTGTLAMPEDVRLFNSALRILYSWLLPRFQGCLIHASAAEHDGRGYLFCGASGAGKTTVSRLAMAHGRRVLTDEIAALRFIRDRPHVFGTPFWGECPGTPENVGVPLKGLFELHKADTVRLSDITAPDTAALLLRSIVNFDTSVPASRRFLDLAHTTALSTLGSALEFSRTDDYWPMLLQEGRND